MIFVTTPVVAGILGVILVGLLYSVIAVRREDHITLGSGGSKTLELRIRGYKN